MGRRNRLLSKFNWRLYKSRYNKRRQDYWLRGGSFPRRKTIMYGINKKRLARGKGVILFGGKGLKKKLEMKLKNRFGKKPGLSMKTIQKKHTHHLLEPKGFISKRKKPTEK